MTDPIIVATARDLLKAWQTDDLDPMAFDDKVDKATTLLGTLPSDGSDLRGVLSDVLHRFNAFGYSDNGPDPIDDLFTEIERLLSLEATS